MGAKEGAWCAIDTVRRPILRVNGFEDGVIDFHVITEKREQLMGSICADGDFDLTDWFSAIPDKLYWIRLSASQPTSDLVCLVVPKPKAA